MSRMRKHRTKRLVSKGELEEMISMGQWKTIYNKIHSSEISYANMSSTYQNGMTLLHYSALHDNVELAKLVLRHNRTLLEQKDEKNHTALYIALQKEKKKIALFLLGIGAKGPMEFDGIKKKFLREEEEELVALEKSEEEEIFMDLIFMNDQNERETRLIIKDINELGNEEFQHFMVFCNEEFKVVDFKHEKLISIKSTFRRNILIGILRLIIKFKSNPKRMDALVKYFAHTAENFRKFLADEDLCYNEENEKFIVKIRKTFKKYEATKKKTPKKSKVPPGKGGNATIRFGKDGAPTSIPARGRHKRSLSLFRSKKKHSYSMNTMKLKKEKGKLVSKKEIEKIEKKLQGPIIKVILSKDYEKITSNVRRYKWTNNKNKPVIFKFVQNPDEFYVKKDLIESINCKEILRVYRVETKGMIMEDFPKCVKFKSFVKFYSLNNFEKYILINQLINIFFYLNNKGIVMKKCNFLCSKNKKHIKLILDNFYQKKKEVVVEKKKKLKIGLVVTSGGKKRMGVLGRGLQQLELSQPEEEKKEEKVFDNFTFPEYPEYSFKSNIFTLGKFIFEIATGQLIRSNKRPVMKRNVLKEFQFIVRWCWNYLPSKRPSIVDLRNYMKNKFTYKKLKSRLQFTRDASTPFFKSKITTLNYYLKCPLSSKMMRNPVYMLESGYCYEKDEIDRFLKKYDYDPITRRKLSTKAYIPNYIIQLNSPYLNK